MQKIILIERSQNSLQVPLNANNHVMFYITNLLICYHKFIFYKPCWRSVTPSSFESRHYHHKIYLLFILQVVSILFKIKSKYEACSKNNEMFEYCRLYQSNWEFFFSVGLMYLFLKNLFSSYRVSSSVVEKRVWAQSAVFCFMKHGSENLHQLFR